MTANFLPLELDVESIEIETVGSRNEWQIHFKRDEGEDLHVVLEKPDPLFDQLCNRGVLEYNENEGGFVKV